MKDKSIFLIVACILTSGCILIATTVCTNGTYTMEFLLRVGLLIVLWLILMIIAYAIVIKKNK